MQVREIPRDPYEDISMDRERWETQGCYKGYNLRVLLVLHLGRTKLYPLTHRNIQLLAYDFV